MFQITAKEWEINRSQFVTSSIQLSIAPFTAL